jgi:hypothetical protein
MCLRFEPHYSEVIATVSVISAPHLKDVEPNGAAWGVCKMMLIVVTDDWAGQPGSRRLVGQQSSIKVNA